MDSSRDFRPPFFQGITLGIDAETPVDFGTTNSQGQVQLYLGGYGYGNVLIWADHDALRRLAHSILAKVDRAAPVAGPRLATQASTMVLVSELVVGDRLELDLEQVVAVDTLTTVAPGRIRVDATPDTQVVWPANHAVKVLLPRPGHVEGRDQAVPCQGLHDMARRPQVWSNDGLCGPCRVGRLAAEIDRSKAMHPSAQVATAGEGA